MMNNAKPRDMDVYEILTDLEKIKEHKNKVEWLSSNFKDHQPLMYILKMNYCSSIVSVLPEGIPPFNSGETDGPTPAGLWQYLRVFPTFVRSVQSSKMKMLQIEQIFIEMLEAIEPKEAELVCLAKDRKLEEKYLIDVDLVTEAFPGLIQQKAETPKIKPLSPEDRASELLETAKDLEKKAKELNTEAREYRNEAKELMKMVKENASEAA
jgi:Glu-tRNA(Gln) amidotransferase subunit E-like FAD-binding protein